MEGGVSPSYSPRGTNVISVMQKQPPSFKFILHAKKIKCASSQLTSSRCVKKTKGEICGEKTKHILGLHSKHRSGKAKHLNFFNPEVSIKFK